MAQSDAVPTIVEVLRETTAAMAQAIRMNENDKGWIIVKRERQFLVLAIACLQVLVSCPPTFDLLTLTVVFCNCEEIFGLEDISIHR